jgi:hypothetical protein
MNIFKFTHNKFFSQVPSPPPHFVWEYALVSLFLATFIGRGMAELYKSLIPQTYTQLVVGDITWGNGSKQPDYLLLLGFLGSFFLIYLGLRSLETLLKTRNESTTESGFRQVLIYALLPSAVWAGASIIDNNINLSKLDWIFCSLVTVSIAILFSGIIAAKKITFSEESAYANWLGGSIIAILFAFFDGVLIVLAINRLKLDWVINPDLATITGGALLSTVLIIFLLLLLQTVNLSFLIHRSRVILWVSQAFLPLGFLTLLPTPWTTGKERFYGYVPSPWLYGLLIGIVVIAYLDWGWRSRSLKPQNTPHNPASHLQSDPFFSILSPICLFALLFYLKSPVIGAIPLHPDDYHWGEFLLPWWSWQKFGLIPFQDFEPARGIVGYATGFLASLFLDGTATSYLAVAGKPLLVLPFLGLTFWAISRSLGYLPTFVLLFLMPNANGATEIDLIVTAALCLLAELFLKKQWTIYLISWAVGCSFLILFAPGQGGIFAAATLLFSGIALYKAWCQERSLLWKSGLILLGVAALLGFATPLGQMLLGAFRYGAEQSSLNSVGYGVEWYKSRGSQTFLSYSLWELVRTSWIVVTVGVGILLYRVWATGQWMTQSRFLVLTVPIFLMMVLFIPRAAGRIGPGSISRLGAMSIWAVCLLLPIILITAFRVRHQSLILLLIALFASALAWEYGGLPYLEAVLQQPGLAINVVNTEFVNGQQIGLPNLDKAVLVADHFQRIKKLKAIMSGLLNPGETFLDLTNRGALHFYLDYPPLMPAAYNMLHTGQQLRALQRIEHINPPVVLAKSDSIFFDGGSASLRTHLVYRYVIEHYVPVMVDELVLLVRPDRLAQLERLADSTIAPDIASKILIGTQPAIGLTLLHKAFAVPDYQRIPSAWGKSFGRLKRVIRQVASINLEESISLKDMQAIDSQTFRVTGDRPRFNIDLTPLKLDGNQAGLLEFDFECQGKKVSPTLTLHWQSNSSSARVENQVKLTPRNGKQLVPLDSAPGWLLGKGMQNLELEMLPKTACKAFSITTMNLHQRVEVGAR